MPLSPVHGPPDGFPLEGADLLAPVGAGRHPGDNGRLAALRVEPGKDAPTGLVGWNPLGPVQKLREPRPLGLPPVGALHPLLCPANRGEDRDGEDRLQGVQGRRMLAPCKGDATPNAITALPEWLRMRNLTGTVVTLEAMGCQVEVARQIQEQGADDVLSFKEHQPSLSHDGEDLVTWRRGAHPRDQPGAFGHDAQVDGGHGRIETRRVWSPEALAGVGSAERWPGLPSLVLGESSRQLGDEASVARRDYRSALPGATDAAAKHLNRVIRTHWEIENRVHWVLDVAMGEDVNRTRKGESAQTLAVIRKLALHVLRQEHSVKLGIAAKQKRAGWDHDYWLKILSQT